MGRRHDSSITRVRPFFQWLLARDPSGSSWLPILLRLGTANRPLAERLAASPGELLPQVTRRRVFQDRVLRTFGVNEVQLEGCFEVQAPPSERFLRDLIENAEKRLVWPEGAELSDETTRRREELMGYHGRAAAEAAKEAALAELRFRGPERSARQWWAFEGFTSIDCLLETDRLVLLVEGKRTEGLSSSTAWYPERNQLLRNLEVASILGVQRGKEFAVLLMAEQVIDAPEPEVVAASLPHLDEAEREELMGHYLGCVTWCSSLCRTFFPDTVEEVAGGTGNKGRPRRG